MIFHSKLTFDFQFDGNYLRNRNCILGSFFSWRYYSNIKSPSIAVIFVFFRKTPESPKIRRTNIIYSTSKFPWLCVYCSKNISEEVVGSWWLALKNFRQKILKLHLITFFQTKSKSSRSISIFSNRGGATWDVPCLLDVFVPGLVVYIFESYLQLFIIGKKWNRYCDYFWSLQYFLRNSDMITISEDHKPEWLLAELEIARIFVKREFNTGKEIIGNNFQGFHKGCSLSIKNLWSFDEISQENFKILK